MPKFNDLVKTPEEHANNMIRQATNRSAIFCDRSGNIITNEKLKEILIPEFQNKQFVPDPIGNLFKSYLDFAKKNEIFLHKRFIPAKASEAEINQESFLYNSFQNKINKGASTSFDMGR